jgi:hypothetical protein
MPGKSIDHNRQSLGNISFRTALKEDDSIRANRTVQCKKSGAWAGRGSIRMRETFQHFWLEWHWKKHGISENTMRQGNKNKMAKRNIGSEKVQYK